MGHRNLYSAHNTYGKRKTLRMEYIRTPPEIWQPLNKEFNFTVDACASDKNHLLPKYWTKENSALDKDWDGEIVYCHPMYDVNIPKFVAKAFLHKCTTVFLLPASTNSIYFHTYFWDPIQHKFKDKVQVRFLPVNNRQLGYKMATDEGILPDRGYLRPLMIVVVNNI
tara:strand:+ start:438 stop:938 length:501 start_codon:yes stop_codon:yes gene_type:complete